LAANNNRCFDLAGLAREIHLQKSVVRTALGSLFYEGRIKHEGEGLKKSPFIYSSLTFSGPLTLAEATRE
jgi:predicted transcriptional regulator